MLDVSLLFKIGGVGILIMILDKLLKSSGKDEIGYMVNIAGLVIILLLVLNLIKELFTSLKTMFIF
ncbi:stage III sporulation protein AC [Alloiococcus sp. CFN-8]|uniref:stage III sporulation protein AC n=1 Tax=Alloiococcus sp. CFN-8 TaxID=3416081 RepID=UPI003CEDE760